MPQGTTRTQPASLSFLFASLLLFLHLSLSLSLSCSLHPLCSSLCPPLCEYSSSFSSSSSYFTSLVLFFLYLCPRTQSLALFLSLSVGSSPFADLRVDQTLQMDTLFLSGATCRTWFPPFLQERSRVSVSCVSQRHPRSKETR